MNGIQPSTTKNVRSAVNDFEMPGVDTEAMEALPSAGTERVMAMTEVVKIKTRRYRPTDKFIGETVSPCSVSTAYKLVRPITPRVRESLPGPTVLNGAFRHPGPEAVFGGLARSKTRVVCHHFFSGTS